AKGINASGRMVGRYFDGNSLHGFLLNNGTYTTLDDPVGPTQAFGINDAGQIVGAATPGSTSHGFLLTITPDTSPPTADMILRGSNAYPAVAGQYEIYDISNNAILAASPLGQG